MRMVRLRPEKRMMCQRQTGRQGHSAAGSTQPTREHPVLPLPTLGKAFTLSFFHQCKTGMTDNAGNILHLYTEENWPQLRQ